MMQVDETPPNKSRKRKYAPNTWIKNVAKKARYTSKNDPIYPTCGHNSKRFKCSTLTEEEVQQFYQNFYKVPDKIVQDNFILKFVSVCPIQRVRNPNSNRPRTIAAAYYVKISNKTVVPVCRSAFLCILNIKKHRVEGVLKRFFEKGDMPVENRGGDHRSHIKQAITDNIKKFIKRFAVLEKHYCRGKSERQYLSSDLSIEKMSAMYNHDVTEDMQCKSSFFRKIFNQNFNIGFNAPQVDVCSVCLEYAEKIKRAKDDEIKTNLKTLHRIHKLRAKAFFDNLREKREDMITLSYDCEKNLVLPKIPDQITYYKRQMYLYNFTVVIGTSKDRLTKDNVFIHSWLESESAKGSNEISSAVYDVLNKMEIPENIKTIRLVSDGCSGQNKNSTLMTMCAKWLIEAPKHIKKLEVIFPITGHSFLPPDRVFALIEKKIKKLDTIIHPKVYYEIFENYGTLKKLGVDWHVQNWKKAAKDNIKSTSALHFKINSCKRFIFTRSLKQGNNILVKGEPNYNNDLNQAMGICKRGKNVTQIQPQNIELNSVVINPKKLKNIDELLTKHFGAEWKEANEELNLEYYKGLLETLGDEDKEGEDIGEDDLDHQEEEDVCSYQSNSESVI